MIRFITPLNWVLGSCFFAIAILYPIFDAKFLTGSKKTVVEQVVDRIARIEQRNYQLKESYIFFNLGKMPPAVRDEVGLSKSKKTDFVYEAYRGEGRGSLIIRARVREALIKEASLPPLTYTYTHNPDSDSTSRNWGRLSGKQIGLF